jgi:hypothetical protein
VLLRWAAAELLGDSCNRRDIRARADPQDRGPARPDERQAPLGRDGRRRQRLRNRDAETVDFLLLGPAPDDADVRESTRGPFEKRAFLPLGLEQDDLAFGKRSGKRNPRRASPRADIHDRARKPANEIRRAKAVLEQYTARFGQADRRQAGRSDNIAEPALEALFNHAPARRRRGG